MAFDLVGANLPCVIFFFAGIINFYRIRSIGFNRVVQFSRLFILKRNLCYLIALLDLVYFVVTMVNAPMVDEKGCNYENCLKFMNLQRDDHDMKIFIGVTKFFSFVVWIASATLLVYEYRKGLSESWYSFKLFWTLTAGMNFCCLVHAAVTDLYWPFVIVMRVLVTVFSILLLGLMLRTKGRTIDRPRGLLVTQEGLYEPIDGGERLTNYENFGFNQPGRAKKSMSQAIDE